MEVIELFGGIGAVRKALIQAGIPFHVVDYVENDPKCVRSYNALYNERYEPKSVIGYSPPDVPVDLLMHGSPCQDFSRVGLKRGGVPGSGTRSSLLFQTVRILSEMKLKPTWVIWENVKGVLDKNMRGSFFSYLDALQALGYESIYQVLNAMDFGIPQKRERLFVISYRGKNPFSFAHLERVPMRPLSDFLEKTADNRYFVTQPSMLRMLEGTDNARSFHGRLKVITDFAYTISTKQVRVPNSGILALSGGGYRYLTERECFRLMGFLDEDVDRLLTVHPRRRQQMSSTLYRQAGNSIVVGVLMAILKQIQTIQLKQWKEETNASL